MNLNFPPQFSTHTNRFEVQKFSFFKKKELVTKEKTAHPHLLFITPSKKSREEKGHKKNKNDKQNMTAKDYKVVLKQGCIH